VVNAGRQQLQRKTQIRISGGKKNKKRLPVSWVKKIKRKRDVGKEENEQSTGSTADGGGHEPE